MPNTGHVRGAQQTKGSVALKKCGDTPEQAARRLGANLHTVGNWLRGHRRPGPTWRARAREVYAIPEGDWDLPIEFEAPSVGGILGAIKSAEESPPASVVEVAPPAPAGPLEIRTKAEAEELLAACRSLREGAVKDPIASTAEKARVFDQCSRNIERVFKYLEANLTEAKILNSPRMKRILVAVLDAATPWPEAVAAIGAVLHELSSADG